MIKDLDVIRGIGAGCDEEDGRVIKETSGKIKAGKQGSKTVNVYMTTAVTFRLE